MVTEGYRRSPPMPPTHPGSRRADSVSTEVPVIYGVLCARCQNTSFFYGVSGPSAARDFTLAMLQNLVFLRGFGLQEGAGAEKNAP